MTSGAQWVLGNDAGQSWYNEACVVVSEPVHLSVSKWGGVAGGWGPAGCLEVRAVPPVCHYNPAPDNLKKPSNTSCVQWVSMEWSVPAPEVRGVGQGRGARRPGGRAPRTPRPTADNNTVCQTMTTQSAPYIAAIPVLYICHT